MPGDRDTSAKALKAVEEKEADKTQKKGFARVLAPFIDVFGLSHATAIMAFVGLCLLCLIAVYSFFRLAPPHTLRITAGAPGSAFYTFAERYRNLLSSNGVQLIILPSQGSLENLTRLYDENFDVDIGFVQGGISNAPKHGKIVSLGSVSYEPVLIFYRSETNVVLLSEFKNKRLVIGPEGSGTRAVSQVLLETNDITNGGATVLLDLGASDAAKALLDGSVDAVFLTGDSAPAPLMRQLLMNPDIRLYSFSQADAYTRRIGYLNKLELPKGSLDFGKNIPAENVHIVGPTVELLARRKLHPALCDLLLETAREVHGNASLLKRKGEFPAPLEHEFPISSEAMRYYKSGKSFLYRYLPFWIASVANRILLVFVPLFVVLLPALKFLPSLLQWRTRLLLYRWYRALLLLERDLRVELSPEKRTEALARLDEVEHAVNRMKVPASFADQFYGLRGDIEFVRQRLNKP